LGLPVRVWIGDDGERGAFAVRCGALVRLLRRFGRLRRLRRLSERFLLIRRLPRASATIMDWSISRARATTSVPGMSLWLRLQP